MILQSLVKYYEALEQKGRVTRPGWCMAKISFALVINSDGELCGVLPMELPQMQGKKTVMRPQNIKVPQMASRTVGIIPNFLCDNSSYLLGVDNKGKPKRSLQCFESAREKHLEILNNVESDSAKAVVRFFQTWKPETAAENPVLSEILDEVMAGYNLIFVVNGSYAQEDEQIRKAWENYTEQKEKETEGLCLVTGRYSEIARTHGIVKGVQGAQSSGAALVSFNAPAFESYGKEQSFNAPVSTYAVYAYTTALNYLLSNKKYYSQIGDTTIVYWSEDGEEDYQEAFSFSTEPTADNQAIIADVFSRIAEGKALDAVDKEKRLNPDQKFYILGLAPNAARLAVRFFYEDSFGNILGHLKEHYERMEIVKPANDQMEFLGIWRMLMETVNKKSRDKKPAAGMSGAVYRAIISGTRYPQALYNQVIQRIRAECDDSDNKAYKITRGRAAILKAFLLRNSNMKKEDITMALNEECSNAAYVLGREFAVLEAIQKEANPGINATIKDRYFNSACVTPASIFPILFRLKNSHIHKLDQTGKKINYEKQLGSLQEKLKVTDSSGAYPVRLTLEEQGMFILGYYHQNQKRFEKTIKEESKDGGSN